MKAQEDKMRPTFHNLSVKMIEYNFWPEVTKNQKNLTEAGIWEFLLIPWSLKITRELGSF